MYTVFFTLISGHRTAKITEIVEDLGGLQSYINWSFYVPQPKCRFFPIFIKQCVHSLTYIISVRTTN